MNREEFNTVFNNLTLRQKEIIRAMENGDTDREIAQKCYVTEATVRQHIRNIIKQFFPNDLYSGRSKRGQLLALIGKHQSFILSKPDINKSDNSRESSLPKQLPKVTGTERSLPKIVPDNGIADNNNKEGDRKVAVTLHIDADVLAWFQAQGERSEELMNAALRIYARAHQEP